MSGTPTPQKKTTESFLSSASPALLANFNVQPLNLPSLTINRNVIRRSDVVARRSSPMPPPALPNRVHQTSSDHALQAQTLESAGLDSIPRHNTRQATSNDHLSGVTGARRSPAEKAAHAQDVTRYATSPSARSHGASSPDILAHDRSFATANPARPSPLHQVQLAYEHLEEYTYVTVDPEHDSGRPLKRIKLSHPQRHVSVQRIDKVALLM